jgi:hypothetical protein
MRSGYLMENRIEARLSAQDYYVEANSSYPDPETGKARELDAFAMAARKAGPGEFDYVFAVLVIECVNNPEPLVFITKEPQTGHLHYHEVKLAGVPVKIPIPGERDSWQWLPDFLEMGKYHHYCQGRVATQFCSFVRKKSSSEWMATHEESQFDSLKKLCSAVDHFVDHHFKSWRFGGREPVNLELYYPVLGVQGDLLDARQRRGPLSLSKARNIQYRRSTWVRGTEVEYQVDVVTEQFFPTFLTIVDKELKKTCRLLTRRHKVVRAAVDRIVRRARRLRSPDKVRAAMDF